MMKRMIVFLAIFILNFNLKSQETPLKLRFEKTISGDIAIIGNSILNRKTFLNKPEKEFNDLNIDNQSFSLDYINIDAGKENFSSSSAYLTLNTLEKTTLIHAGLYWFATYPYAEGKLSAKMFVAENTQRDAFDVVKIKLPNSTKYERVIGEILYDGKQKQENSPYLAYADITEILKKNGSWQGQYTLANIRASIGQIKGGASAGWAIVFVFEKNNAPLKKISLYDGFFQIENQEKSFVFNHYTPSKNEDYPKFIGFALGGNFSENGSSFSLETNKKHQTILQTETRKANNFLNGSITEDNDYVFNRKPNSLNNFGVDIFSKKLSSENIFPFEEENALKLRVSGENQNNYLLFLGAAIPTSTEINKIENKKEEVSTEIKKTSTEINKIEEKSLQIETNTKKTIQNITDNLQNNIDLVISNKKKSTETKKTQENNQFLESSAENINENSPKKGFYTIFGAFSSESNAQKLMKTLQSKDFLSAGYFLKEDRKLYYVFEGFYKEKSEAIQRQKEIQNMTESQEKLKDLKEFRILEIK